MKMDFSKDKTRPQGVPEIRRSGKIIKQHIRTVNANKNKMRLLNYSWCR